MSKGKTTVYLVLHKDNEQKKVELDQHPKKVLHIPVLVLHKQNI